MSESIYTRIKQHFEQNALSDVHHEAQRELSTFKDIITPGDRIAVAVGSRGIDNLVVVLEEVLTYIREKGGQPFIVPAMGSHGGATAAGQAEILTGYGVTESMVGAPIRSSMDVVEIPGQASPHPVYMDKLAYESDGVFLINRIKPHTDYHGPYESGLVKMSVIGLGKEKMASTIHRYGIYGLREMIPPAAEVVFSTGKILGGLALIENAYDETMLVRALPAGTMLEQEPALLDIARANMPSLPLENIDVLIIDRMGKNISGVGLDPNIIGRMKIRGQDEPDAPCIKAIIVTDLTAESHGNATGIGLADVITRRLYDKIDYGITRKNIVTSGFFERGKVPLVAESDQEAFSFALRSCGYLDPLTEKVVRIKDTLHLSDIYVSRAALKEIIEKPTIEVISEETTLFDSDNKLVTF